MTGWESIDTRNFRLIISCMERKIWRVVGYDTFEEEFYSIHGADYVTEEEAQQAARVRFDILNKTQPMEEEDSGGQDDDGIQDRIFIERPDGSRYRFILIPQDK